ncbi:MAG: hypothetical protein LC734_02410, partial [Acidobacteria bacterium]|nr:hypothetical protein [Acidobacteriota bacterium]
MRKLAILSTVLLCAAGISAQTPTLDITSYGVRIEPDKRVMAVLAALETARTGDGEQVLKTTLSNNGQHFREQLKSDLTALPDDLRQRISTFVIAHKRRNAQLKDEQIVAQFTSMAYALGPAPDLADPIVTGDLPGGVLDVLDFAPLVREFYRRSSFSANLPEYVKTYQKTADGTLRTSTRAMIGDLLGYLNTRPQLTFAERVQTQTQKSGSKKTEIRNTQIRERERRFAVVPEMLAPKNYVHFVNIRDDYFVVLPPDTDVSSSDVRRAYLQFVVDPIVLNNAKDIASISGGIKGLIEERRKEQTDLSPDVFLAVSRSLVAAIDAKQTEAARLRYATDQARAKLAKQGGTDPTKQIYNDLEKFKQQLVDARILRLSEDYEKGALLAFYFADQLKGIEESETDIAASMREMVLSFDAAKEAGRYASFVDARNRAIAARKDQKSGALVRT